MEDTNPETNFHRPYILLLLDTSVSHVLVMKKECSKIAFPKIFCSEVPNEAYELCHEFTCELEFQIGINFDLIFLYSTRNELFRRNLPSWDIIMFECTGPLHKNSLPLPASCEDYKWMNISDINTSMLESTEHVQAFRYLSRCNEEPSDDGVRNWEKPGWFKETTDLVSERLREKGYDVTAPIDQYLTTSNSILLKITTNKGLLYFKGCDKKEIIITQCVADIYPNLVRAPLLDDVDKGWMVMEDYGPTLSGNFSAQDFEKLQVLYGKLQLEASQHLPKLLATGIRKADPLSMVDRAKRMLEDPKVRLCLRDFEEFAPIDKTGIPDLTTYSKDAEKFLKYLYHSHNIPLTLVHGDVLSINIAKPDPAVDKYVLFDWAEATIDIPLSDIVMFKNEFFEENEDLTESEELSVRSYLSLWTEFAPLPKLKEIMECIRLREELFGVVGEYERWKKAGVEPYLNDISVKWLRSVLKGLREKMSKLFA